MAADAQDGDLQEYSTVLEQLNSAPFQRDLHVHRIALALQLSLADEVEQARQALAQYFPLSQTEWFAWLDDRKSALPPSPVEDVASFLELVELYRRASREFLSIPLLVSWSQWTISSYYTAQGLSSPPPPADADDEDDAMEPASRKIGKVDELLGVVFSLEEVRSICDEVLKIAGAHIADSSKVWTLWRDFETDLLKLDPTHLLQVEQLYLARLKVPHLDIAETFSAYSSFVTAFDNENYDKSLPAANKIFSGTAKRSEERYAEEEKLKSADYTPQAYLDYVSWEREVKRPDTPLVKGIFERAVADHPTEIDIWDEYMGFLHKIPEKDSNLREVSEKAVRNLPTTTSLWTAAMRVAEKLGLGANEVEALFQRALATGYFKKDIEGHVALYHARASYYRREMDRNATDDGPDAQLAGLAIGVLQEGIDSTKTVAKKGGDPQFRLEKFLIRIYERFQMTSEARAIWEGLCQTRQHSYAVWYGHADFETRMGDYAKAHQVYTAGCAVKGLDYPEYLLDAWITFENEYGVLADVDFALVKAKRQRKGLEKRRAREAAEAAEKAAAALPATDADSFIASAVARPGTQDSADASKKRERSPQDESTRAQGVKKVRVDEPEPAGEPKRDREHSTVFAISSGEMSADDVRKLFRDCGDIRELHVKTINDKTYAQIEFMNKESVLAAQTKDKKRINDRETEVYIAWQSCLYVTNFPESFDKAALEHLFEKYGTIFDTRWPSKRFKQTRRFCYVQFANPAHAQAALELDGTELEPGLAISVLISDPSRKKSRSDAGAHQRELYVASLAKSVKEADLRKLFEPFGALVGIRIPQDDRGMCKGFAFVEFESEASAQEALQLNNHELKKRNMSVTVAQARQTGTGKFASQPERRVETENRGVRVRGLSTDTQEAIIQQAFEKMAPVRRVNYIAGSTEAVVLLENPADVGKVLMQRDALDIGGQTVTLLAEGRQARPATGTGGSRQSSGATGSGEGGGPSELPLMPRQATRSRGRVGLVGGRGRGGRGGRLGIGAGRSVGSLAAQAGPSGSAVSGEPTGDKSAEGKSQDDFRAMLLGKKE